MTHIYKRLFLSSALAVASFSSLTYASTPSYVLGVPIATFCNTYAKDVATKSVGLGLIVKIKEDPSKKASLMRQYGTFLAIGKQYCKGTVYKAPPVNTGQLATTTTTNPALDTDISQNTPIINTSNTQYTTLEDYFTGYDTSPMIGLTIDQVQTTVQRIAKAKQVYGDIINDFIGKAWLQPTDRDAMVGKIAFNLSNNCNELDGKILVRQWFDQNHNPLNNELISLSITINLCFQAGYEASYDTFIKRIVYHELGHYINYFHDTHDIDFKKICWSGTAKTCADHNFITTYAATLPDEDYAETFSYYVQDGSASNDPLVQRKIDYFASKFPK